MLLQRTPAPTSCAPVSPSGAVAVFGIPDYDPVAERWLDGIGTEPTLLWDRQGWLSSARDARLVVALPPSRKVYIADIREAADDAGLKREEAALEVQPLEGFEIALLKRGEEGVAVFSDGRREDDAVVSQHGPCGHAVAAPLASTRNSEPATELRLARSYTTSRVASLPGSRMLCARRIGRIQRRGLDFISEREVE